MESLVGQIPDHQPPELNVLFWFVLPSDHQARDRPAGKERRLEAWGHVLSLFQGVVLALQLTARSSFEGLNPVCSVQKTIGTVPLRIVACSESYLK